MRKKNYVPTTPSESVKGKLENILSVFTKAVSDLNGLTTDTQDAITLQDGIITKAQAEKQALEATLTQIVNVKQNIESLIVPAT